MVCWQSCVNGWVLLMMALCSPRQAHAVTGHCHWLMMSFGLEMTWRPPHWLMTLTAMLKSTSSMTVSYLWCIKCDVSFSWIIINTASKVKQPRTVIFWSVSFLSSDYYRKLQWISIKFFVEVGQAYKKWDYHENPHTFSMCHFPWKRNWLDKCLGFDENLIFDMSLLPFSAPNSQCLHNICQWYISFDAYSMTQCIRWCLLTP